MSKLNEYLTHKRNALLERRERFENDPNLQSNTLKATVRAAGRSGVREIRIRDFQIISDSPDDFAGHELGPSSPESQLGVLGSCITHITLIQAADRQVKLDSLEVKVTGEMHPLAGRPGYEHIPICPHNIEYTIHITSPESEETIAALHEAVEKACPILNLLSNPQTIRSQVQLTKSEPE
ncbi:OsmC family protein [Paenibacillus hodogayensis]|uniref:OsmC family protein n=1 Tax=Paenibacillus hodogayensis TaxID=279208 RepID=A0ABV5W6N7_9BACL